MAEATIPPKALRLEHASLYGGAYRLLAVQLDPPLPQAGAPCLLHSWWRFSSPPPAGYGVFAHLEDPRGQLRAVADLALPELGATPAGRAVHLSARLELPRWFDSDQLVIHTGLYRGETRLPADPPLADGQDRLRLPPLPIARPDIVRKQLTVPPRQGELRLDGRLDEAAWRAAAVDREFWQTSGAGPAPTAVELRLLYDQASLYVGFVVTDADLHATLRGRDQPLYDHDDVVEVFIDADGDGRDYWEVQVSAAGTIFDAAFSGGRRRGMRPAWDSGLGAAVALNGTLNDPSDVDTGWSAELALPLAAMRDAPRLPPQPGDRWRAFFYRIDRHTGRPSSGPDYQGWVPVYTNDFHLLPLMGTLVFGPAAAP